MSTSLSMYISSSSSSSSSTIQNDHVFHPMGKTTRKFAQIIQEIAGKYSISLEAASQNWLIKLSLGNVKKLIYGYDLGLNSSTAAMYCHDKAATSDALGSIAHIEHTLFLKPENNTYSQESSTGVWSEITKYAEKYNYNLVCKPKSESGGANVTHTKTPQELQKTVQQLFERHRDLCLSPFYEIKHEYRLIMLNGQPEIIFRKIRPHLIGDGKTSIRDLVYQYTKQDGATLLKTFSEISNQWPLDSIHKNGELVHLTWKHNLCQGASCEFIDIPTLHAATSNLLPPGKPTSSSAEGKRKASEQPSSGHIPQEKRSKSESSSSSSTSSEDIALTSKLIKLAQKASNAVSSLFASVDIVQLSDGSLKVMEINNGVMMENLIRQHGEDGYKKAKVVYEKAICQLFNIPYRVLTLPPRMTRSNVSPSPSPVNVPLSSPPSPPRFTLDKGAGSKG